jgi:hypothetical protein
LSSGTASDATRIVRIRAVIKFMVKTKPEALFAVRREPLHRGDEPNA